MDCAGKCHFRKTGIALDKQASAQGSSELGAKWWELPLDLQALQRAHLPADNRKIGGHPPLSGWNFPSCQRNSQIEFKVSGCWCRAFGRGISGFVTMLVWGRLGIVWGNSGTETVWSCPSQTQNLPTGLELWTWSPPGECRVLEVWRTWCLFACWHHWSHLTEKPPQGLEITVTGRIEGSSLLGIYLNPNISSVCAFKSLFSSWSWLSCSERWGECLGKTFEGFYCWISGAGHISVMFSGRQLIYREYNTKKKQG